MCLPLGILGNNPVFYPIISDLRNRGVLTVAAIGNNGAGKTHAPANYPNTLAVGALATAGNAAPFSGSLWHEAANCCLKPELLAPGTACTRHGRYVVQSRARSPETFRHLPGKCPRGRRCRVGA